jgi:hypothetical protein
MNGQIFISYRRDDSSAWARLVYTSLFQHFSQNRIFMDVDNLDPGVNFFEAIDASVGSCDVLIAVIGKSWLIASDEEGRHRLDNPDDLVRREIATALKRDIRVIPVLVDGALMPRASELPDDLRLMVSRNALEVSHSRFNADLARLITALERLFEKADAERKQRAEDELSEHRLQPHPPIPVAIVAPSTPSAKPEVDKTFVKTPKMVYPLPSKPTKPEPVKPSASWSGGTGGKGGSKQIVAFLAIAAALILGGLIYLAIRASHWPMSQPAKITASAPNPPVIATPTIEEKALTKPEMAVEPPRRVPVVIPSASISATPLQAEVTSNNLENATKDHPWTNSLGMRFVPVAGTHVLFSIWDTRVQDFEAFVKNTNYDATSSM